MDVSSWKGMADDAARKAVGDEYCRFQLTLD